MTGSKMKTAVSLAHLRQWVEQTGELPPGSALVLLAIAEAALARDAAKDRALKAREVRRNLVPDADESARIARQADVESAVQCSGSRYREAVARVVP